MRKKQFSKIVRLATPALGPLIAEAEENHQAPGSGPDKLAEVLTRITAFLVALGHAAESPAWQAILTFIINALVTFGQRADAAAAGE